MESVDYKLEFVVSGNFLKVILSGTHPVERFREISEQIDKAVAENNIGRILVDMRKFTGRFGVFDGIRHIENFPEQSKYVKFAILDVEKNKQSNDFFENASYNRGFSLLFFYSEEDALKWLEVQPSGSKTEKLKND
jgi:hypothetical protein